MHLLAAQAGAIQQDGEAIDLGQSPGRIVFASAADSELAGLAEAVDCAGRADVRLASTLRLAHNYSVDLWLEKTVSAAAIIVVRLLGGMAYWRYGVEELSALAAKKGTKLVLLPGDANPDPELMQRSNVGEKAWLGLHALFAVGGAENLGNALELMVALAQNESSKSPQIPQPVANPPFGIWTLDQGIVAPERFAAHVPTDAPIAPILFYRAALEGGGTATIRALIAALKEKGLAPLPLLVSSLKQADNVAFVKACLERFPSSVILNLTGFALGLSTLPESDNPFAATNAPILQLVQAGRSKKAWAADIQGLAARDLAMQVVLPELDGRIGALLVGHKQENIWHKATECPLSAYAPYEPGIAQAAQLAANWVRLRQAKPKQRRIGIVLANYPIRDGRLANGVGYDAPQSTVEILKTLLGAGYDLGETEALPQSGNVLIERLQQGPTNARPERGKSPAVLPLDLYRRLFAGLPQSLRDEVVARWGAPESDPFCRDDGFHLPVVRWGNVALMLQPARGYHLDEEASFHDPDLVPPHAYCAAYLWLRHEFGTHALIHNGKHGNLEWLPGKAVALDEASYPLALWGTLPHFYPFIVNDPGEGTQAKRRTGAVIIDHLVPPLTRAETYGPLKDLEALLDEYYNASGMDQRRLKDLRKRILGFTRDARLDVDLGLSGDENEALNQIDTYLCDLKEAQIRDGLHIYGQSPTGRQRRDLLVALARVPRGEGAAEVSLIRALANDLGLGFDPLSADLGQPWTGPKPEVLLNLAKSVWRTNGDTLERLEELAAQLIDETMLPDPSWRQSGPVLEAVRAQIAPLIDACGQNETKALIEGLNGKFIAPGPSGAPSRGRLDVLPTGRNFFSLDNRALPTQTAWLLGQRSAELLIERHFQDQGTWLKTAALSAWGTANMRTGGDDIAQALALIGAKPKWDPGSLRVSGYEIIPLAKLGRPRVDVTLRISGFFRDAFPQLIALFDRAIRAIGALDEPEDQNPIAARMRTEALKLMEDGMSQDEAGFAAGHRVFGSKPGAYGAGLQGLIDSGKWRDSEDLARAFENWGHYAYGAKAAGTPERDRFRERLARVEAVVHNQDNREHDLLDSDDYYQFEGGLVATIESLSGLRPIAYHNDHSRPESPRVRTLEEEISRVMRSRVVNPKWIEGVRRHGYKGAFEIIATVDYMFAFAATTGAVKTHHFDLAFEAFVLDDAVRDFLEKNNAHGYAELLNKFEEARQRGFWTPKSNSVHAMLARTRGN